MTCRYFLNVERVEDISSTQTLNTYTKKYIACVANVYPSRSYIFVHGIFRLKFPLREDTHEKSTL